MRHAAFTISVVFVILNVSALPVVGEDIAAAPPARFYAKGWNVARLDLPGNRIKVETFGLSYSDDGEHFKSLNAGLPRPGGLFKAMHAGDEGSTFLVSLVGRFRMGPDTLLFPDPGSCVLRWDLRLAEGDPAYLLIDQPVQILPPRQDDLEFLRGLSDPDLIRAMFGADFFERQTGEAVKHYANPDGRAVKVVGQLLVDTRERVPGAAQRITVERGNLRKAADIFWQLAQDIPDSTYAPYAAYYAGRCFTMIAGARVDEAVRSKSSAEVIYDQEVARRIIPDLLRADDNVQRARETFQFAAERGDAYLAPLARYHLAGYHAQIGETREAERLLREAEQGAGNTMTDALSRMVRKQIEEVRRRGGSAAVPSP